MIQLSDIRLSDRIQPLHTRKKDLTTGKKKEKPSISLDVVPHVPGRTKDLPGPSAHSVPTRTKNLTDPNSKIILGATSSADPNHHSYLSDS